MRPLEVFLSHAAPDRSIADRTAQALRRHGVPVWYAPTEIMGGRQWHDEIGKALLRCDWFVVLPTPHACRSMWVRRELLRALTDLRYENRIVPVMVTDCDPDALSWTLASMQMIDVRVDFDAGCRDLLRTWGIGFSPA